MALALLLAMMIGLTALGIPLVFALLAIALFFLAGELMTASGVVDRILGFARALVGHVRGGLGQVGVISSVVMAGVSGSAVADAAAIGPLLIRSMRREGY